MHINSKVKNERPGSAFKLLSAKLERNSLTLRIKSPERIDKQFNAQGLTKSLNRSYCIKNIDIEMDNRIANHNLEDIKNI